MLQNLALRLNTVSPESAPHIQTSQFHIAYAPSQEWKKTIKAEGNECRSAFIVFATQILSIQE